MRISLHVLSIDKYLVYHIDISVRLAYCYEMSNINIVVYYNE